MHERIILVYWRAQNIENVKNCAAVIFEIFNYNSKSKATEIKLAGPGPGLELNIFYLFIYLFIYFYTYFRLFSKSLNAKASETYEQRQCVKYIKSSTLTFFPLHSKSKLTAQEIDWSVQTI